MICIALKKSSKDYRIQPPQVETKKVRVLKTELIYLGQVRKRVLLQMKVWPNIELGNIKILKGR